MGAALRLVLALARRRAGLVGGHVRARGTHLALLAAFGLATLVFLLALATAALASALGMIAALAIMAGVSAAGCGVALVLMRAERRAHEAALRRQSQEDMRLAQAALLAAAPGLRRGAMLAIGVGTLAATLLAGRRGGDPPPKA